MTRSSARLTASATAALRVVLAAGFALALLLQGLLLSWLVTQDLYAEPTSQRFQTGLIGVLGLVSVQVTMVCVWRLVTMARAGAVVSEVAYRYVDVVIVAVAAAAALTSWLGLVLGPGRSVPSGVVLLVWTVAVALAGTALVAFVLRRLLAQAVADAAETAQLRAELDAVV